MLIHDLFEWKDIHLRPLYSSSFDQQAFAFKFIFIIEDCWIIRSLIQGISFLET